MPTMSSSVDLDALKAEIDTIGGRIRDLKSSGGSKEDIGAAVQGLKAAKQEYADNNNGIGVDGKPFTENLTKAQKKALAKAETEGAAGGGDGNVRFSRFSKQSECSLLALAPVSPLPKFISQIAVSMSILRAATTFFLDCLFTAIGTRSQCRQCTEKGC